MLLKAHFFTLFSFAALRVNNRKKLKKCSKHMHAMLSLFPYLFFFPFSTSSGAEIRRRGKEKAIVSIPLPFRNIHIIREMSLAIISDTRGASKKKTPHSMVCIIRGKSRKAIQNITSYANTDTHAHAGNGARRGDCPLRPRCIFVCPTGSRARADTSLTSKRLRSATRQ